MAADATITAAGTEIPGNTQASDTATAAGQETAGLAADKATREAADKAAAGKKTYTEDEVLGRLRGQGSELKRIGEELAAAKARVVAFEAAEAERARALMTAEEKARADAATATQAAEAERARSAAAQVAIGRMHAANAISALKPIDAAVVLGALPPEALDVGPDLMPTPAAKAALTAWIAAHPVLFAPADSASAPGAGLGSGRTSSVVMPGPSRIDTPFADYAKRRLG